ncbi:MAG: hypothetical protein ACM3Q1_11590 [Bacteroidales bacterium]
MAGLFSVLGRLFGRDGDGEAVPDDPAIRAFKTAADIAASYGEIAARNVASLVEGGYRARILEPFEPERMLAALNVAADGGVSHYVTHSLSEGQMEPVTLRLLWSIHQNIMAVDQGELPQDHALELCSCIHADSLFLHEELCHVVRIAGAGLGARVLEVARNPALFSPRTEKADRKLADLIRRHRSAVDRLGGQMERLYPHSPGVQDRVVAHTAVETPVWLTLKDHQGARVINEVWFPEEFAKPLVEHLTQAQGRAMAAR